MRLQAVPTAILTLGAAGFALLAPGAVPDAAAQGPAVSFTRDVRPILMKRCAGCHQPASRSGRLSVVTYAALKSGGASGPGFVSGKPEDSPLYKTISGRNPTMPKGGPPLSPREVELIRRWIAQGGRDDTPAAKDPIGPEHPPVYTAPPVLTALAFSPDGALLAVSGYREILLHRADGSGLAARLVGRSQRIESLAFSPDGRYLAAAGGSSCRFGELQLWDVSARKLLHSVEIGFDLLYGLSFSPDGRLLAFGGAEKAAYLYTVPECQPVLKFENHSDWVFGTAFSTDGRHFITTSRDRAVKLVEIATRNFVDDINYQVYNGGYYAIARHPKADEIAVAGDEGIVRYYSIYKRKARTINREDYNLLRTFGKLPGPIHALAFSPDGSLLAAGGRASEVWVFRNEPLPERIRQKREAAKLSPQQAAQQAGVPRLAELEQGAITEGELPLAQQESLRRWLGEGVVARLSGFAGSVHALAWSPKGDRLAVGGFDGSVHLYALPSGQRVRAFVPVPLTPKGAADRVAARTPRAEGAGR